MANRTAPARRYFGVLVVLLAALYALVFLTGSSRTPALGLDLRGGTTVTLTAKTPDGRAPSQADLELARQIIEQRVNGLGVAGAEVITQGSSNIVISVPGDNGRQARELGTTAQLRFRPVITAGAAAPASSSASASASPSASPSAGAAPTSAPASASASSASSSASSGGAVADNAIPKPGSPPVTQAQAQAR